MGVAMGDKATVNGVSTAQQWKVAYSEDDRPYVASNTQRGTARDCGILDRTGQYWGYGARPAVFPGDDCSFVGEATTDVNAWGTSIVERLQIAWQQEENQYVHHVIDFAGNGALTLGDYGSPITDATVPGLTCGAGLIVTLDGVTLADVRKVYLDISRRHGKPPGQQGNKPYSSSSVPGAMRRKKGWLDYKFSIDCYVANWTDLPALQDEPVVKIYDSATTFWHLKWGRIVGLHDIGANVEDGDLLHVVILGKMQGTNGTTLGWVKSPGEVTEWP